MKAVVVGAGHNGLVASFYLAGAGFEVEVFERREVVGGAAESVRHPCGCVSSPGANAFGILRPRIREELDLYQRGLRVAVPDPQLELILPGRDSIQFHLDVQRTIESIGRISRRDSLRYVDYLRDLDAAADVFRSIFLSKPPKLESVAAQLEDRSVGLSERFLLGSVTETMQHYFEDSGVQAAVAATSVLSGSPPSRKGTAFALAYLATFEVDAQACWGVVIGGMGSLSRSIADAATDMGVKIRTGRLVQRIRVEEGTVIGVELGNGAFVRADVVISNADPFSTTFQLVGSHHFPTDFVEQIRSMGFDGGSAKLELLVDRLSSLSAAMTIPGISNPSTLSVICPDLAYLETGWRDMRDGKPSRHPYLEITCPSTVDPSVSCGRHHPISVFSLYNPYELAGEATWDSAGAQQVEVILNEIGNYSDEFLSTVVWSQFLSPRDIEDRWGMHRGNVDHGNMLVGALFEDRPSKVASDGATPVNGLYMCGAGVHPGGLVTGAPGFNAAHRVLELRNVAGRADA